MIGLQRQILSELDPSDPEQQLRVAQKYARSAPDLAMRIANEARTALVRIKQAQSVTKQGVTPKIQVAERIATDEGLTGEAFKRRVAELLQSPENLSEAERKGARVAEITRMLRPESGGLLLRPAERAALEAELDIYQKQEKAQSFGDQREAYAGEMFENKTFAQLTPSQKGEVNKRIEEARLKEAKATAPSSGIKEYKDIPKLRADIISTVKPFRDTVNAFREINDGTTSTQIPVCIGLTPPAEGFIPYDQLTKDIVDGWLDAGTDKEAIDAELAVQLENIKNPKVQVLPNPF